MKRRVDVNSEWPLRTIEECAADEPYATQIGPFGKALMADEYVDSGVPVLRGVNVNRGRFHDDDFVFVNEATADRLCRFEAHPGDVLLVHKGTLGKIGLLPKIRKYPRYIMGNSMMRVKCDRTMLLPDHLYYWLCSTDGQHYLFSRVSQVGVPQIQTPLTTLRQARLPVPPLAEQIRITEILGTLDDKIELNQRMNEVLEAIVRTLFVEMTATTSTTVSVSQVAAINFAPLTRSDKLDFVDYVEISAVHGGEINDVVRYARGTEPSRAKRRVRHGDTVLSTVRPDRGAFFLALAPADTLIVSTGFAVCSPRKVPWSFLYVALTRPEVFAGLGRLADGAAYPAVRPEIVAGLQIEAVDSSVSGYFHKIAAPLLEKVDQNHRESHNLAELRDTLLPKLLSGELGAVEAEREIVRVG